MAPSSPLPDAVSNPPSRTGTRRWLRVLAFLLLAGAAAVAAWMALGGRITTGSPEALCLHAIRALEQKDADTAWNVLTDGAREEYGRFVKGIRENPDTPEAARLRQALGVSKEDFARLSPREILRLEVRAAPENLYAGARVREIVMRGTDEAVAFLTLRDGVDRVWLLRKVDDGWKIQDLTAHEEAVPGKLPVRRGR